QAELAKLEPDQSRIDEARAKMRELQKEQSRFIVKDEFDAIMSKAGGVRLNASTSWDSTNYYVSLPSNRLELLFWLESDRVLHPVLREFYSERDVVVEERRTRTDDNPDGRMFEVVTSALFSAQTYGQPVIGWPTDVRNLTTAMAEEFRGEHYGPRSVVFTIVGNVDPDEVIRLADKYFSRWQADGHPHRLTTKEPVRNGEVRIRIEDEAEPSINIGWNKPGAPSKDDLAFSILDSVLTDGRTSRLHKKLVLEKRMASSVGSWIGPGFKYDNAFMLFLSPLPPYTCADLEQEVYRELELIANDGVTDKELQRVLNQYDASYIESLQSNGGLARQLTSNYMLYRDAEAIDKELERLHAITSADVQDVVKRFLTPEKRVVVWREKPNAETASANTEAGQ
ncbi:insulinase family protein, partial [Candidatus Poribacteria bacterium]|nr:insulinase family protein [Candidatus Poribacteria bacterium]